MTEVRRGIFPLRHGPRLPSGPPSLTDRQLEVLRVYAETGSQLGTAKALGISVQTVKTTLSTVRSRLDVDSSVQAVLVVFGEPGIPL